MTDELRDVLVPINKKYPISELLAACRAYPGSSNARRITFEYVMLNGVNDSPVDARALAPAQRLALGVDLVERRRRQAVLDGVEDVLLELDVRLVDHLAILWNREAVEVAEEAREDGGIVAEAARHHGA